MVGFNSAKLLLEDFKNSEFGMYERYSYTQLKTCIVMTVDWRIVAIGAETEQETVAIYGRILENISK